MTQQNKPFAFYVEGSDVTALKYRDGEFHSDLSALTRPYSGFRELGLSDDSYARAYMACVWLFRAINVRVLKVAEVLRRAQLIDRISGRLITEHPYIEALELAYQLYMQDVYEEWSYSKAIYGETYVEKVKQLIVGTFGIPKALRVLNAVAAEPVIERGAIVAYRYNDDAGSVTFGPQDIVFDRTKNPLDDTRGFSLIAAAMDAVNIDRSIIILTRSHLKNNARPGLIFTPKEGRLSQADVDLILSTLAEDAKGPQNSGQPLLMPTAFDVTVADPPSLADVDTMADQQKRRICSVVGVPVALVDYQDFAFQLSPEQKANFYELTLIPEAERIVRVINAQVLPFFDPRRAVELRLPLDDIRAELGDPVQRTSMYSTQLRDGAITLNEYRTRLGHKAASDGNVRFVPPGVQIVPEGQLGAVPTATPAAPALPAETAPAEATATEPPSPPEPALPALQPDAPIGKAAIDDELRKWRKKATQRGALKAFTASALPKHLETFIREELEGIGDNGERSLVHAVFDAAEMMTAGGDELKAYYGGSGTREGFRQEVEQLITAANADNTSRRAFAGKLRAALRRYGLIAFRDGMEAGGYTPESLSTDDVTIFKAWLAESSDYVSGVGEELFITGNTPDPAARSELWVNKSLDDIYFAGLRIGAPTMEVYWHLGQTEEHCDSCLERDGKKFTVDELGRIGYPRDRRLICGGWKCDCFVSDKDGKVIGAR